MTQFGLFTLLLILCSLHEAASEIYYIITNSANDICTGSCLTLSEFAAISSHCLYSNITLVFLPGTHYLTVSLTLSNVDNFIMKSENSTVAQIKCTSDSHIYFSKSQCIHITNLEFIGCGGNQVKNVEEFVVEDTILKGEENSGTALEITETAAWIINSIFVSNKRGSYRKSVIDFSGTNSGFIGGAIIATNSIIDISQCKFEFNRADFNWWCTICRAEQHHYNER